jgi:hypothetical protein
MSFDPAWNQLGLYYIPSENEYTAYFLKRSWGNYLFFPHPEVEKMYPFILASGGIYKVFDTQLPYPFYNKKLFDKFGAPTIGVQREFHEDFLIESYPGDYFDVDLKIEGPRFQLMVKNSLFTFVDASPETSAPAAQTLFRLNK